MTNPATILCFGDSNTWGYNPANQDRFPRSIRWTGRLQTELGSDYHIIEEGLNGRTTVLQDPLKPYLTGLDYLPPCLDSHHPIARVFLLLGTNDLKVIFKQSPEEIAQSIKKLGKLVLESDSGPDNQAPYLTLIAPPPLAKLTRFDLIFREATEKSKRLGDLYSAIAADLKCNFIDLGKHIRSSDQDGIHWDSEAHQEVAAVLAEHLRSVRKS